MIVDEAHGLHERVAGRGSHEGPPSLLQVFRQRRRLLRDAHCLEPVSRDLLRAAGSLRFPGPEIGGKGPFLVDQLERALRVVDRRFDLAAMADDAGVFQQPPHVARTEAGHRGRLEILERPAEVIALAKDGDPAQAGLKTFQADLLEETAIVGDRPSPFLVVIPDVERVLTRPPAPLHFFLAFFSGGFGPTSASSCALTFLNSERTAGSTSGKRGSSD